ncbi:MAG: CYTH domain-containing protein [Bacteroidales bacterium]|nr:CYTH domain-containing protein [Bacteroidales bacterium]MDY0216493.1 CYTH domain-containing protein [Bacteroidales bacterium]
MAFEIERKFLVNHDLWDSSVAKESYHIIQGYIQKDKDKTIRIRIRDEEAFLTIKSKSEGIKRFEFEYQIPISDAKLMLSKFTKKFIEKTRFIVEFGGKIWEVDEFEGNNKGLLLAEIELEAEDEPFEKPEWVAEEVSLDMRYHNSNLIDFPMNS